MIEPGLTLSRLIYGAHNQNSFCGAQVVGARGVGKSSYALRVAHEVYRFSGMTANDAWRKSLDCLKFEIHDVIKFLRKSARADTPEYLMIWDDVGVYCHSSLYFSDFRTVQALKSVLDTIRTACSGMLLTTPTTRGLLGVIKSYDDHYIEIRHTVRGGMYRSAHAYKFHTLPSGKRLTKKRFIDSFSVYLPEWVFQEYQKKRKEAQIRGVDRLEKALKLEPITDEEP